MPKTMSESDQKTLEALEHFRMAQIDHLQELDILIIKIKRKYELTEQETVQLNGRY